MDNFNWLEYIRNNDDLKHINNKEDAYKHYINYGKYENRIINKINFDYKFYTFLYNDLKNIKTEKEALIHYKKFGKIENRVFDKNDIKYKLFDWFYYINKNNGLSFHSKEEAFKHYINYGIKEKRLINDFKNFDTVFYNEYYKLNNISKENSIFHYLNSNKNNIFINSSIYNIYQNFNFSKYSSYYKIKNNLFNHYINNISNGYIYFHKTTDNQIIKKDIGIAISLYINKNTPNERILCSKICLNSIFSMFYDTNIIIVIDNHITNEFLYFLFTLIDNRKNIKVYLNKKNFGISKTKNICIKLLEELNVKYITLLDDDVEILQNFNNYVINIFEKTDIPLISNYNFELPFEKINYKNIEFIKTKNYFGNIIIINQKYIKQNGYMNKFKYKWGEEHVDLTYRYLINTPFYNFGVDFSGFINNSQVINGINTLHLHSCNLNNNINKNILFSKKYCDFIFDKSDIIELNNEKVFLKNKIYKILKNFKKSLNHFFINNFSKKSLFNNDCYIDYLKGFNKYFNLIMKNNEIDNIKLNKYIDVLKNTIILSNKLNEINNIMLSNNMNNKIITENTNNKIITENTNNKIITENTNNKIITENTNNKIITENTNNKIITENTNNKIITENTNNNAENKEDLYIDDQIYNYNNYNINYKIIYSFTV